MKLCMGCMNQMEDQVTVCPHCGFNERELKQEAYYLTPGTVVGGKYIIGRALSYAGYTVTYIGMDAENNRKVLVKEYLPNEFSTRPEGDKEVTIYSGDAKEQFEEGLTTFLNEANRIQQLGRPQGIMQVYDCVAENDTGYVISEYLEGQTLAQILEGGKKFSPQEAKEFICEILEGLRRVHPLDVVHCDIAPETILVTRTGEIKLLDFGATRYVTTANSKSLAIILKQGYAPEEQYRSQGVRGPWTDVYALGAVMYHMITGIVPIESVDRALVDELKAPSQLGVPMPKNMENALMNALNVYQKDRTPSAEVFYQELNSDEVKRIQVKKQKYETGRFPKWAKALVAGVLCVVVAGGVVCQRWPGEDLEGRTEEKVPNLVNLTEVDAEKLLNKENLRLELGEVIFDQGTQEGGKIITQKPTQGESREKITEEKITVVLQSKEKCEYKDLDNLKTDVRQLMEKFHIKVKLVEAKGKRAKTKSYGNLYEIRLQDGKIIEPERLKDSKEILEISNIKFVSQYAGSYFYVKKLKNYRGKNINKVLLPQFEEDDNGDRIPKGVGKPEGAKCYYSFEEDEGYIVEQDFYKEKYNSKDMKSPFKVVKKRFYNKDNAKELIDELEGELNDKKQNCFKVKKEGQGDEIADIETSSPGGCKYFKEGDTITIHTKQREMIPTVEKTVPPKSGSNGKKSLTREEILD